MWLWAYLNSDILLDVISMSHNEDTTRSQSLIGFKRSLHKPNRRAPCDSCSWPDDHPPDALVIKIRSAWIFHVGASYVLCLELLPRKLRRFVTDNFPDKQ